MQSTIIAREEEQHLLNDLYRQESAELVSITGRRRVGKTFLVTRTLAHRIDFHLTGTLNGDKSEQLKNFGTSLARAKRTAAKVERPTDWQDAFYQLEVYLQSLNKQEKLVIFLDELPWLATHRSGFLPAFSYFWNSWAEYNNIMVVICGSAASWMINKVVRDRGGLHNRITKRIQLEPFNLKETRTYLQSRGFRMRDYDIAETYMAIGGIPHYLKELDPNETVAQNLDRIAFTPTGILNDEFNRLYPALFDNAERHIKVIRALAGHHYGLDRRQIIQHSGLPDGGTLTRTLEELEFSGFIRAGLRYGRKNRFRRYRLIDEYSNFYLKFMEGSRMEGGSIWQSISSSQRYKTWRGYAFENLGLRHYPQLKQALGIGGVATSSTSFHRKGRDGRKGIQIDLLIERADRAINLCEFKFYGTPIKLTAGDLDQLEDRRIRFQELSGTDYHVFTSLVAPFGIDRKTNKGGVVNQVITLADFFAPLRR